MAFIVERQGLHRFLRRFERIDHQFRLRALHARIVGTVNNQRRAPNCVDVIEG